ncbi:hypothetical protein SAMN00790413_05815 [Deinococcus hopiensis KR-140]|uniref:Uncharacterized protein n=1 Tax=Deinococcus hopiensis KR-140 TaxID=695939 RepID=A0A1W1UDJ5_9DEIO|nr:hypothetical protein SAMN00790413_05815 [Deinococcus hopiensis KR-140]
MPVGSCREPRASLDLHPTATLSPRRDPGLESSPARLEVVGSDVPHSFILNA